MLNFWIFVPALIAIFCLWQTVRSIRSKDYWWAAFGASCAALIVVMPIESNAIAVDLPAPAVD